MMRKHLGLALVIFGAFHASVVFAEEVDCGAAGDGCASKEWQAFEMTAVKQFPDWPEIGYRTYASMCSEGDKSLQSLCLKDAAKAAKIMKLPPEE